ncbi:MAG: hypothetical protein J6Y91_03885 [Alphaproteobacteria bacterium]|nr:hypothetical protein [Alphaproteobacteria bacterium]
MRKYLLLASVAGCLMSAGSAMAGTIDTEHGSQSAVLNVKMNLVQSDTIASVQDMDFGTLAISGEETDFSYGDELATISTAGVVTSSNEHVIISSTAAAAAGAVTFTNSIHDVKVVCTQQPSIDLLEGGSCDLAATSGLMLSNLTMSTDGKTRKFGAKLYTYNPEDMISKVGTGNLSYPGITVTISY